MNQDKATLRYHGKSQVRHAFELLAAYCVRVFISCRQEQAALYAEWPQIHDTYQNLGPLSGILSAMLAFPDAAWLVLANDMPYVDGHALQTLIQQRHPSKTAVAYQDPHQAFPEPLCAIYEPNMRSRLLQRVAAGRYSLYRALEHPDIQLLSPVNSLTLLNVNDPDGYQQAVEFFSNAYPPLPLPGGEKETPLPLLGREKETPLPLLGREKETPLPLLGEEKETPLLLPEGEKETPLLLLEGEKETNEEIPSWEG